MPVARRHSGAGEHLAERRGADVPSVVAHRMDEVGECGRVAHHEQRIHRHRLAGTRLVPADLELATRQHHEVAVAGGIDEHRGTPGLTA